MKKLLGIVVLGLLISTHPLKAKDLDWTGKRALKYADTVCLALGVKEDAVKNSPWHECKRQYLDVSQEYEKQYCVIWAFAVIKESMFRVRCLT